jgi:hypothetical protein
MRQAVEGWTVDFGAGPVPCEMPHLWGGVDVRWEGPAIYRTSLSVPEGGAWLTFERTAYAAELFLNGDLVATHHGLWDAWSVPVPVGEHQVELRVTKNGGPSYPVKQVASGFYPYVFHTWGGVPGRVWLSAEEPDLEPPAAAPRVKVEATHLWVDGKPFFMQGVLTWGWDPTVPHLYPSEERARAQLRRFREAGFNTVKFCLWVPPHEVFEWLAEEGLWAWLELPLWMPSADPEHQAAMADEVKRIVRQYRRHDRIIAWTVGCELSHETPASFRADLTEYVKATTGCPLEKDNSGGAEMYGGDPREYGTFADFHPYCDGPFFASVLRSLQHGPRPAVPILLGETNDFDHYRALGPLQANPPFWASADPALNDQGVRWQFDLPEVLAGPVPSADEEARLRAESILKGQYLRTRVAREMIATPDIAGYVITGERDTGISTAGIVDDHDQLVGGAEAWQELNAPVVLFPIPYRLPPWVNGGNRPGFRDPFWHFAGQVSLQIGARALKGEQEGQLEWQVGEFSGTCAPVRLEALQPGLIGELVIDHLSPGCYPAWFRWGGGEWRTEIHVEAPPETLKGVTVHDPLGRWPGLEGDGGEILLSSSFDAITVMAIGEGRPVLACDLGEPANRMPFWRECIQTGAWLYETLECPWSWLWGVGGDATLDPMWASAGKSLITRIDTRTYRRAPYLVLHGNALITTLRPEGGLGDQPPGLKHNPAGWHLLRRMIATLTQS